MKNESFIQLLIEYGPADLRGAMIWVNPPTSLGTSCESGVIG